MCRAEAALSFTPPRAQYGHSSSPVTWMSSAGYPSSTGEWERHQTRAPPSCAATCPAHHSAHSAPYSPTTPSDAASPGWEEDDVAARITRRPSRVARPGQTAALGMRVDSPEAGSEARTRASAAPSHPRRRLRVRRTITTATTQAMAATTPASVQSTRGDAAKVCRRQAMRPPMTTRETRGAPRRREDPEKTPRPR